MTAFSATVNSQFTYADALDQRLRSAQSWLDLGCGHQFLPEWMADHRVLEVSPSCRIVGIDLDTAALRKHKTLSQRIVGNVEHLPIASETFDLVTANMVLEHVADPTRLFHEVARVLRLGGVFLLHTPNSMGYTTRLTRCIPAKWRPKVASLLQGRAEDDVYRTFYRANSIEALKEVARIERFSIAQLQTIGSSAQLYAVPVVGWLENQWLHLLDIEGLRNWRPCIIAQFIKT